MSTFTNFRSCLFSHSRRFVGTLVKPSFSTLSHPTRHDSGLGSTLVAKSINWGGDLNSIRSLVIYEDNHLLALYKPSSVLMQGDMKQADNLLDAAKRYLTERYDKSGGAYLGLVHRLDRVTSGISVFAKTSKAAARLCEQFKTRKVIKYYLCVVNGDVELAYGECNHLMTKTSDTDKKTQILPLHSKRRDTVTGVLRYRVVHRLHYEGAQSAKANPEQKRQTLLAVELETGRKHQIRAQLAHIGHPIVGDVKYGAPQRFPSRDIALHAAVLSFPHPTTLEQNRFGEGTVAASQQFISRIRDGVFKYCGAGGIGSSVTQSISSLVGGLDGDIIDANVARDSTKDKVAFIMRDVKLM